MDSINRINEKIESEYLLQKILDSSSQEYRNSLKREIRLLKRKNRLLKKLI